MRSVLLFVCGIAAVSALEQHKIDDRLERLQNKIKDLGISATPEQVKHGLAKYDTDKHALAVKKQGVTKMLNNGDVWTGCGHTAHVDKRTFDKILIYGRPRDTSDECPGTFDYSSDYCVSSEFVSNHAPGDWRVWSDPAANMFHGPCTSDRSCGDHTCEEGDYCGYDTKGLFSSNKHVCIKMYPTNTNETFGSPTGLKLAEIELIRTLVEDNLPEGGVRCMHNVGCSAFGYDCDGATCPCTSETKNCGDGLHCVTENNAYWTAGSEEPRYCLPYSGGDRVVNGLLTAAAVGVTAIVTGGIGLVATAVSGGSMLVEVSVTGIGVAAGTVETVTVATTTGKMVAALAGVIGVGNGAAFYSSVAAAVTAGVNTGEDVTYSVEDLEKVLGQNFVSTEDLVKTHGWTA